MKKQEHCEDETRCIDDAICPKCKKRFNGEQAINYEIGITHVYCPYCNAYMEIYTSVEYQCKLVREDGGGE